jgi:Outer membrane protein beta-barrel domain
MKSLKISIGIFILMLLHVVAPAQKTRVNNLEKYDKQKVHFGFLLGINSTDFRVTRAGNFYKLDSVLILEPKRRGGFNLGIISDLKLGKNFNLRFVPELAFSQRDIEYFIQYPNKKTETVLKKVESTFLNFPIDIKFKSDRVGNYRFYVLGGFRYSIDMVSQAKVNTDEQVLVKLKKEDFGYEIGFGIDCYLELFKFAPEIKMFQGIPNVLAPDAAQFTTSISALKSRVFSLAFTFE